MKTILPYGAPIPISPVLAIAEKTLGFCLLVFFLLAMMAPAHAATITVDTTDDVVADDSQCSLREAIINANDNAATHADCAAGDATPDEIVFDAALIGETITLNGIDLPHISEALSITGPLAGDSAGLTLDAGQDSRIFLIVAQAAGGPNQFQVDLTGLTLTNGQGQGGAVAALYAGLNLKNVFVTGNTGIAAGGGGLYVFEGNLTLIDSVVSDNSTSEPFESGGGIRVKNQTFNGEVELINSTVSNNSTKGDNAVGGGLYITNSSVTLTGSTVSNNSTSGAEAEGGGLAVNGGNATLENSTVSGNSTTGDFAFGGGLAAFGDVTLENSTVSNNSTQGEEADGGGLSIGGTAQLTNSTVSGNSTAGSAGAGLAVFGSAATLRHSTIAFNTSGSTVADGIHAQNTLDLENTLIVQAGAGEVACNKLADSTGNSLATDASCTGTATDLADINLGPLAFNGGPTQTHALLEGSVAIDAANSSICNNLVPIADQRGVSRPPNAIDCDIGAYEVATEFDMGDAPDADPQDPEATPPASYPTLFANNGAAHMPISGSPILGALIDYETDGQPTADADGDDTNNLADEDGVFFTSDIEAGMDATVDVTVTNGPALLNAWIDFNADGDWNDAGEQIFTDEPLVDGSNAGLTFSVPEEMISGVTFARFRLSTAGGLTPDGMAVDGEVEDYKVSIAPPMVTFNSKRDNPAIRENRGTFIVLAAVLLSNPSSQEVTVDMVFDAGASEAEIPVDFDFSPTTVVFAPGETSADVEITIVNDGMEEGQEIAVFNLANPVNASVGTPDTFQARLLDPGKNKDGDDDDDFLGCTMGRPGGPIDPLLPLLVLLASGWLLRRKLM